jgi:DNA ligase-1
VIAFARLYADLDSTTKTNDKVAALVRYFRQATPADAAWAIAFLSGRRPKRLVNATLLRQWATEQSGLPEWLFDECYDQVGDLAETIALLLPAATESDDRMLAQWVESQLLPLQSQDDETRKATILDAWRRLDAGPRFVWNKLITGAFRVGVSQLLVVRALADVSDVSAATISHRLMGDWSASADFYERLIAPDDAGTDPSRPYPFFLSHPIEKPVADLGPVGDWQAEWKWDGIRAQLIRRQGQSFVWTRGEELVTDRYPELTAMADRLPDGTVLDGELLPWADGRVRPFAELQKRIGRKTVTKKLLAEIPVVLLAYDLLEHDGTDLRESPLRERRNHLETVVTSIGDPRLAISETLAATSWADLAMLRQSSRERGVEGLMLKRLDSPYRVGRVTGDWWKWKVEPLTMDAVLTAAQRGHGKRAGLYTDYTFAVWDNDKLVTIAKAYSGLTDQEIREVDAFVKANTLESFGPVRTVTPQLVFEIGFEGINASTRHKSGLAVRFPRILRRRTDKSIRDADTIERLRKLLGGSASPAEFDGARAAI